MEFRLLKPAIPATITTLFLLTACGGSSTGISVSEPADTGSHNTVDPIDIGAALPDTNIDSGTDTTTDTTPNQIPVTLDTITGKVADGYLRGATVCVDINENESCDDDEPQTVSAAGGAYTLNISDEHSDKPILAEVPAEAIDEDTGQAFGRDVIFSTPADRPGFISPLTTLVQQELKDNPALSLDDAEAALEEALGLDNSDGTGLFKDYVALAETGDETSRQKYRYMHQTARVVAGMMGDIRESVKDSVTESGMDLEGDKEARKAMRQLIQSEVRELIPEIAQAVANKIHEIESADESADNPDSKTLTAAFNPDELIESLRPDDITDNVSERIESLKEESTVENVSMQSLLAQGIYTLDIDCEHSDEYDDEDYHHPSYEVTDEFTTEDNLDSSIDTGVSVVLNDDGELQFEELPEFCTARYSTIMVEADSNDINIADYYYDADSADWLQETDNGYDEPNALMLVGGEWVDADGGEPEAVVEYTEDGGVVLSTDGGTLLVNANGRELDDSAVAHHLRNRGAEPEFYKQIDQAALFPTDSWVYRLFIKRRTQQHVLFNWQPEDDNGNCSQYSENCNLIDIKDDQGFVPVTTIADLQEGSLNEITINEIFYDYFEGVPVDLALSAEVNENGDLPVEGKAHWMTAQNPAYIDYPGTVDGNEDYPPVTDHGCIDVTEEVFLDAIPVTEYPTATAEQNYLKPDSNCPSEIRIDETDTDNDARQAVQFDDEGGTVSSRETKDKILGHSRWKLIDVDGQVMIEIQLPVIVRHRFDQDEVATFLLAEQGGFVRRGMRMGDVNIDNETAYSKAAFETLKPLSVTYVNQ